MTLLLEPIGREWDAPYIDDEDFRIFLNSWNIPGEGEDKKERRDFTFDELQKLRKATPQKVLEVFWLMHLMIDTGLRINECCGLQAADVY